MTNDVLKTIKGKKNGLRNDAGGILEYDERLTLVLDAPRHEGPQFRVIQGRHARTGASAPQRRSGGSTHFQQMGCA
jgi:hypothetical protein